MIAYLVRALIFFAFVALGLWGFFTLPMAWGVTSIVVAFLVGGTLSMISFKRLATEKQIKDDLEARLFND
ncbi:MAG: hypothetical protein AAGK02_14320 [Pseudomonadota bacterium]